MITCFNRFYVQKLTFDTPIKKPVPSQLLNTGTTLPLIPNETPLLPPNIYYAVFFLIFDLSALNFNG